MRVRRTRELALLAASTLVSLVMLELGCRVQAYLVDRHNLETVLRRPAAIPPNSRVGLRGLLQLSPNPRIIYELVPNLHVRFVSAYTNWGFRVDTNAAGFRDTNDYPLKKPGGVVRIVGLGDSLMWGWGVATRVNYLSLLERQLNEQYGAKRWQVINTAVPGYNTAMEIETLQTKGLLYEPDVVIIGFCPNDLQLPNFIWPTRDYFSITESFLADFMVARARRLPMAADLRLIPAPFDAERQELEDNPERVPAAYRDLVGWASLEQSLRTFKRLSTIHQFVPALLVFGPLPNRVQQSALAIAGRLGIPVINVGDLERSYMLGRGLRLATYYGSPLVLSAEDHHPSRVGHELAAEAVLSFLARRGLLTPRGRDDPSR